MLKKIGNKGGSPSSTVGEAKVDVDGSRESTKGSPGSGEDDGTTTLYTDGDNRRRSSYFFDDYEFESTIREDDNEESRAELAAKKEEKFLTLAQLKDAEYSKMDIVKMATSIGGLYLDQSMVDPVPIPKTSKDRLKAVQSLYGPDAKPDTVPYVDPVTALEETEVDDDPDRVRSPPDLYKALQSNFLKSNYTNILYRLILMGTHDEDLGAFIEWNAEVVDAVNTASYTEPLCGILCVYEYYYIHVLEGSEDNLYHFMEECAQALEPSGYEWDLKFTRHNEKYQCKQPQKFSTVKSYVLGLFRQPERVLPAWRGEKVFPNRMYYDEIPPGGFREKYYHFLKRVLTMVFTYCRLPTSIFGQENEGELTQAAKRTIEKIKIQRFKNLGSVIVPVSFIQYVLDHKDSPKLKLRGIRVHLEMFGGTPPYVSPCNTQWPAPGRLAPYD